jgi:hypothetical protein
MARLFEIESISDFSSSVILSFSVKAELSFLKDSMISDSFFSLLFTLERFSLNIVFSATRVLILISKPESLISLCSRSKVF